MTLFIDPPNAAGHGRMWSHLASDTSYDELHAFARELGIPERGFDHDHYDVPAEWYHQVVALGVRPISSRELIIKLRSAGLRRPKREVLRRRRAGRELLRPARLTPGDLVAVVSPAGSVERARLDAGLDVLHAWGLRTRVLDHPIGEVPWLAGPDDVRADLLTQAWTDPEVRAVWAGRGGFGSHRILDRLDWALLRRAEPRWLIGFSDVTALHQAFAGQCGVVTVHAPGVAGLAVVDDGSRSAVWELILGGGAGLITTVGPVDPGAVRGTAGVVEGVLVGGNLTVLAAGAGAEFVHPATGSIAVLEDIGERAFRLDRAFTQLHRSGWFEGVVGVVCGSFEDCSPPADVRRLLRLRLAELGVPVAWDAPIGHGVSNHALPLGTRAQLDVAAGQLRWSS